MPVGWRMAQPSRVVSSAISYGAEVTTRELVSPTQRSNGSTRNSADTTTSNGPRGSWRYGSWYVFYPLSTHKRATA